jgi:prepilin-type processing-associated H-X9-DG protein
LAGSGSDALNSTRLGSYCARSKHSGGVNTSLCDGSVRFISNYIDLATWRALSTAAGSESLDPKQY